MKKTNLAFCALNPQKLIRVVLSFALALFLSTSILNAQTFKSAGDAEQVVAQQVKLMQQEPNAQLEPSVGTNQNADYAKFKLFSLYLKEIEETNNAEEAYNNLLTKIQNRQSMFATAKDELLELITQ